MDVEMLDVGQNSRVSEVRRLQSVFAALVMRMKQYKSYMPAALFADPEVIDDAVSEDSESTRTVSRSHTHINRILDDKSSTKSCGNSVLHQVRKHDLGEAFHRRAVSVLVVNLKCFSAVLGNYGPWYASAQDVPVPRLCCGCCAIEGGWQPPGIGWWRIAIGVSLLAVKHLWHLRPVATGGNKVHMPNLPVE